MGKLHSVDKPIFRYWNAFYMAFYSRRFYIDVGKRWRGYGLTYLFLLILVASIPLSIGIVMNFNHHFDEQMMEPIRKLPDIYIQNGSMYIDKPMPYLIKNKHNEVVAVIDAKATSADIFKFYPKVTIFINESTLYFKPPQLSLFSAGQITGGPKQPVYENPLSDMSDSLFNGADWIESSGVEQLKWYTDALVFPAIAIFFFSIYVVFLSGLAIIGQGVSWVFFKMKLKYKESSRLCLTAVTPQVFVFFTCLTLQYKLPGLGISQAILFTIYFCYAALSLKRERKGLVFA